MVIEKASSRALPREQLQALYQIIERMNSVYELPELLAFILDRVLEHTGGRRGYLLLSRQPAADESGSFQDVAAARGEQLDQAKIEDDVLRFVSGNVARDVLKQGEPRVIEDLQQDERYRDTVGPMTVKVKWRSILAIPLKAADRLIGLMYIEHPGRQAFPTTSILSEM